jgi:hypothetical protein
MLYGIDPAVRIARRAIDHCPDLFDDQTRPCQRSAFTGKIIREKERVFDHA